jgi:DNA processing protein
VTAAVSTPSPSELRAWLSLLAAPGIGSANARRLLKAFGSPEAVMQAASGQLVAIVGDAAVATALQRGPDDLDEQTHRTLAWLAENDRDGAHDAGQRRLLFLGDADYPDSLLNSPDPPVMLYLRGRVELLARPSVAIVGSRNATAQGEQNARSFAEHFSRHGLTVVSGLAAGIDAAAHEGALNGHGSTVAVVGTGIDRIYPRRNEALARRIVDQGLMVSEYPLGMLPLAPNFPRRNRLIAGLSLGTLVVEAAAQSGSLITAREAADAGREVFAIPGSIHSPQSRGCHQLLRQGAKLVEVADDVLEELRLGRMASPPLSAASPTPADPLLEALGFDPQPLDALAQRTGLPTDRLLARLLELELAGQVARLPGGLYQRIAHA